MPIILVKELSLDFRLRRSERVKHLQLVFREQTFEVVAPPRITNQAILYFVWQKRQWMANIYQRHQRKPQTLLPSAFYSKNSLWFRGKAWPLFVQYGTHFDIVQNEENMVCRLPIDSKQSLHAGLLSWLRAQAYSIIQSLIYKICPMLGEWPSKVLLKQQKTRWGSCGINGTININWVLIFAPEGVLEYVVVHELCHLIHRNHGVRFWQKVAKYFPDYDIQRKWLRKYGDSLMRMDVS